MKIKTIDITALDWFDKVNGNSYFAGTVTINFGSKDEKTFNMPFQYGYDEHYVQTAKNVLFKHNIIKETNYNLSSYCRENDIILRTTLHLNCKKRELVNFTI